MLQGLPPALHLQMSAHQCYDINSASQYICSALTLAAAVAYSCNGCCCSCLLLLLLLPGMLR
jgi:hypothetical protein